MVDATAMGTICVKVRKRSELNMILERMGEGESLLIVKDLTFDYEFLEEGRTLQIVNKEGVNTKAEVLAVIAKDHEELEDGKFVPEVLFAFFQSFAVLKSVADIAENMAISTKQREEDDFVKEIYEEAGIGKDETFNYNMHLREWDVPEVTADDARKGDERYVSGGAPKALGEGSATATAEGAPPIKKITKYMTGERDEAKKVQKIYVEDEDVVNCDESRIKVSFKAQSYSVQANTAEATYVLGPIEVAHIVPGECSWRLSKGKRLTLTLRGSKEEEHPAIKAQRADDAAMTLPPWAMAGAVGFVVMALLVLIAIGR